MILILRWFLIWKPWCQVPILVPPCRLLRMTASTIKGVLDYWMPLTATKRTSQTGFWFLMIYDMIWYGDTTDWYDFHFPLLLPDCNSLSQSQSLSRIHPVIVSYVTYVAYITYIYTDCIWLMMWYVMLIYRTVYCTVWVIIVITIWYPLSQESWVLQYVAYQQHTIFPSYSHKN